MKARRIIEAMDLGGEPDAIHPSLKRALAQGTHPLGQHPSFAPQGEMNPAEHHSAETYRQMVANLRRYGGVVPRNQRDLQRPMVDMLTTLQDLMRREEGHQDELQELAVETALRLPELKSLRAAVDRGDIHIDAKLGPGELEDVAFGDEVDNFSQEPQEIQAEMNELVAKRKMLNTLIQGAAAANNYAATYYAGDELAQIDPGLERDYGKIMAYSQLSQFVMPQEAVAQAVGSAEQRGGSVRLKRNDDGSTTIQARGLVFPMLVYEIVKGCVEFLSLSDTEDPETMQAVYGAADVVTDEQFQQMFGPSIWHRFIEAIGHDSAEVMPYVYDHLNQLPTSEFNEKLRGLLHGTPEGRQWFTDLTRQIKSEIEGQQEGKRSAFVRRLTS